VLVRQNEDLIGQAQIDSATPSFSIVAMVFRNRCRELAQVSMQPGRHNGDFSNPFFFRKDEFCGAHRVILRRLYGYVIKFTAKMKPTSPVVGLTTSLLNIPVCSRKVL
jgi:hypothetical protein